MENGVRTATLWRAVLGVEKTVIESVEYDEEVEAVIASAARRAMTAGKADVGGGAWTWAPSRFGSRPMLRA